jgi:hypothetical protein
MFRSGFVRAARTDGVELVDAQGTLQTVTPLSAAVLTGLRPTGIYVTGTVEGDRLTGWLPATPPTRALQREALHAVAGATPSVARELVQHATGRLVRVFQGDGSVIPTILRHGPWVDDPDLYTAVYTALSRYVAAVGSAFAIRLTQYGLAHDIDVPWSLAVHLGAAFEEDRRLPRDPAEQLAYILADPWRLYLPLGLTVPKDARKDLHALVDGLATAVGISADDPRRVVGAVRRDTSQAVHRGDIYTPWAVSGAATHFQLTVSDVCNLVRDHLQLPWVPDPKDPARRRIGSSPIGLALAESAIAMKLVGPRLMGLGAMSVPEALAGEQAEAAAVILENPLSFLAGPAGSGKSYVLAACAQHIASRGGRVAILATTGIAAQRLGQVADMPGQTLHSFIGYVPDAGRLQPPSSSLEPIDLLIVDEASMLDSATAGRLADFVGSHNLAVARVCLAGDPWQLPPVGAGRPFHDLLDANLPTARLTAIRRTEHPELLALARQLGTTGDWDAALAQAPTMPRIAVETADAIPRLLEELAGHWSLDPSTVGVIAPRYDGPLGITALNAALRRHRLPDAVGPWAVRDRVIQTHNWRVTDELTLWNGQMGEVVHVGAVTLTVQFGDTQVEYPLATVSQFLMHAYALSVHRSQGGQFPGVLFVLDPSQSLDQALVYTGVTRAVDHLALVHPPEPTWAPLALRVERRRTLLPHHLAELLEADPLLMD